MSLRFSRSTLLTRNACRLELAKPIRQLAWRPGHEGTAELAVAGEDGSVRICSIDVKIPQGT